VAPIECRELYRSKEDAALGGHGVGSLRLWMDIVPSYDPYSPAQLDNVMEIFEIRVTILDVRGITIFRDLGQRNDAIVHGCLHAKDYLHQEKLAHVQTDVHAWSRSIASFQWRWIFRITAPLTLCALELRLMDKSSLGDVLIYNPVVLPLDYMVMIAFLNWREGRRRLGVSREQVIFDTSPMPRRRWSCCWRWFWYCRRRFCCGASRRRTPENLVQPARMFVEVEILSKEDAEDASVEPGRVAEPSHRLSWSSAIENPDKFMQGMCGPENLSMCKMLWGCFMFWVILVAVLLVTYLILQSIAPALIIWHGTREDKDLEELERLPGSGSQ